MCISQGYINKSSIRASIRLTTVLFISNQRRGLLKPQNSMLDIMKTRKCLRELSWFVELCIQFDFDVYTWNFPRRRYLQTRIRRQVSRCLYTWCLYTHVFTTSINSPDVSWRRTTLLPNLRRCTTSTLGLDGKTPLLCDFLTCAISHYVVANATLMSR